MKTGLRIITTYRCNEACSFCYQKNKESVFLDPDKLRAICTSLSGLPEYITVMGGEVAFNPDNTRAILSVLQDTYPTVPKSITTNGTGSIKFYSSLALNNLTVSMPILNPFKIYLLKHFKAKGLDVRVNHYTGEDKAETYRVFDWCQSNDVRLTLCPPLEEGCLDPVQYVHEMRWNGFRPTVIKANYAVFDNGLFKFWIYNHSNNYNYDNTIVLPNGTVTEDFQDVIECHGAN